MLWSFGVNLRDLYFVVNTLTLMLLSNKWNVIYDAVPYFYDYHDSNGYENCRSFGNFFPLFFF